MKNTPGRVFRNCLTVIRDRLKTMDTMFQGKAGDPDSGVHLSCNLPTGNIAEHPCLKSGQLFMAGVLHDFGKLDALVKSHQLGWLSKNRHLQGAQISRNEAHLGAPQ